MTVQCPSRLQLEEPREKKKCSFVHIVLCCCHAVSIFLDTKRSAKRKNAIDEPKNDIVKVTSYTIVRVLPPPMFVCNKT